MTRLRKRFLDCKGLTMEEAQAFGESLATYQRDIMWWLADLQRFAERKWPDTHHQIWPEWVSPGMLARATGVGNAYPQESDREHECTYSQYMQNASKPDRQARLESIIDKGLTTDESRKADREDNRPRWLLAIDVNYYLHRFWFSGAGVEAAVGVAQWVQRTVERLKEKGLTDVACCFDGPNNHRKELTKDWDDKYKDRPEKDQELVQQISLVRDLLAGHGFACVLQEGMEGDDLMASYAAKFDGRVTILSQDKDLRQCLSGNCNILLDVEWTDDETTGDAIPEYKWLTASTHIAATGIPPRRWADYQSIMGDNVDGVKGAIGIGAKGAADLIKEFGSVDAIIAAAKADDERIKQKKREALIEFEGKAEVTRQLVTLRTDLPIPETTRV